MIIIVSNKGDKSTQNVIHWLNHYNVDHYLLDNSAFTNEFHFNITSNGVSYSLNGIEEIHAIWFRRNDGSFSSWKLEESIPEKNIKFHRNTIKNEISKLKQGLYENLRDSVKSLGNYSNSDLNKITQLIKAQQVGLNIPSTSILTSKSLLKKTLDSFGPLITKPIHETVSWQTEKSISTTYTEVIDEADSVTDHFLPSLVQGMIEKEFEIRSFFLDNKFYSMAIFSQSDDQTKVDFRRYNTEDGNRTIPYQIDECIADKLKLIFEYFELNTGSVDLIKSTDGKIYFLEINPVGQYGMVSIPCNYNLDKKIAEYLIQ